AAVGCDLLHNAGQPGIGFGTNEDGVDFDGAVSVELSELASDRVKVIDGVESVGQDVDQFGFHLEGHAYGGHGVGSTGCVRFIDPGKRLAFDGGGGGLEPRAMEGVDVLIAEDDDIELLDGFEDVQGAAEL